MLRRAGHTEATVDLARLAGFRPVGVLIEVMNEDGTMARVPDLREIADTHGLTLITIKDLIAYRMRTETLVQRVVEVGHAHGPGATSSSRPTKRCSPATSTSR